MMYLIMRKLVLFVFIGCFIGVSAQRKTREQRIAHFIESYNARDYRAMKKDLFFLGRIVVPKKALADAFSSSHSGFGEFRLLRTEPRTGNRMAAILQVSRDTTEPQALRFVFNKRNKLKGFVFESPTFNYRKDSSQNVWSSAELAAYADSLLRWKGKYGGFSGCMLVMDSDRVVYKGCQGYADRDRRLPLTDTSVFELASCSKQFTAFAVLKLAALGKLRLNDSVFRYIPTLPYRNITIEQLLTHTSGVPDYMTLLEKNWDHKKIATNNDVVEMFAAKNPKVYFEPGERHSYSNTGYVLLASVVEKVSGKSYNDFMREDLFVPLGMRNSLINNGQRGRSQRPPHLAQGFVYSDSLKRHIAPDSLPEYDYVYYLDGITGDGMVNTTINDLVIFENALRAGKVIDPAYYEKACTRCKLNSGKDVGYGYGLSVSAGGPVHRLVHHTGSWPGFYTVMARLLDRPVSVAVLSNNEYLNTVRLADHVLQKMLVAPPRGSRPSAK